MTHSTHPKRSGVRLHYRLTPKHRLEWEEAIAIQTFKPERNNLFPDPAQYRSLRIVAEDALKWTA